MEKHGITFRYDLRASDSRIFEEQYEENLQLEDADKNEILDYGLAVWMYVDGKLAGESYGIRVRDDTEEIEDTKNRDPLEIYCYSTTILPEFQSRGYGKILKAHWLGYVRGRAGVSRAIIGHATTESMLSINKQFGAVVLARREKWYDTDRVAYFYAIDPE